MSKVAVSTAALIALGISLNAYSAEYCYQISAEQAVWSKTPESLCVDETSPEGKATITLKSGLSFNETVFAVFNMDLLQRAKCIDCNEDVYGVSTPADSVFNSLTIRFSGKKSLDTNTEEGTVLIGSTKFFYEAL